MPANEGKKDESLVRFVFFYQMTGQKVKSILHGRCVFYAEDSAQNTGEQFGTFDNNDFHQTDSFQAFQCTTMPAAMSKTVAMGSSRQAGSSCASSKPSPNAAAARPKTLQQQTIHLTSVRSISGKRTVGVCPKKNLFVEFLIDAAHGCTVQQV